MERMRRAIVAVVGTRVAWAILLIFFGLAAAVVWLLLYLLVWWAVIIPATGGSVLDCEAANIDCGALADFTLRTSPLLEIAFAVASVLIVLSIFAYRRFTRD